MLVVGEHLYYYEVAKLPGTVAATSTSPLSSPRDFLCTDFTLSLTVDASEGMVLYYIQYYVDIICVFFLYYLFFILFLL